MRRCIERMLKEATWKKYQPVFIKRKCRNFSDLLVKARWKKPVDGNDMK